MMICCMSRTGKLTACTGHTLIPDWRLKSRVLPWDSQSYVLYPNQFLPPCTFGVRGSNWWCTVNGRPSIVGVKYNLGRVMTHVSALLWRLQSDTYLYSNNITIMGGQRRRHGDTFIGSADSRPNQQCHCEILDLKGNYGAIIVAKLLQMRIVL